MDNNSETHSFFISCLKDSMPYITTFALSTWGCVVNYIQSIRKCTCRKFSWKELAFDIVISTFAGLLTYFFCKYSNIDETISAVLIAISGHMGTRAIAGFEIVYGRILNIKCEK